MKKEVLSLIAVGLIFGLFIYISQTTDIFYQIFKDFPLFEGLREMIVK